MGAAKMFVRRRSVALLPMMQRGPGTGLAADPQHLDLVERRTFDPRCVGADQRVLDVLKDGADVLRQRHGVLLQNFSWPVTRCGSGKSRYSAKNAFSTLELTAW